MSDPVIAALFVWAAFCVLGAIGCMLDDGRPDRTQQLQNSEPFSGIPSDSDRK